MSASKRLRIGGGGSSTEVAGTTSALYVAGCTPPVRRHACACNATLISACISSVILHLSRNITVDRRVRNTMRLRIATMPSVLNELSLSLKRMAARDSFRALATQHQILS